jgi:hypothetical protein
VSARHARGRAALLPRRAPKLKAGVGDRITVVPDLPGRPERHAVIVEVQNGDGSPPYVVVWTDTGQRALLYPAANVLIEQLTLR